VARPQQRRNRMGQELPEVCERAKASRQHTAAVQPIAIPARRFTHIHVDIVGPLPAATCGSRYLFTVVDRSSRWLEALPMSDMATTSCADALIAGWISRYGVPAQLTSDRGTQFTSAIWDALCQQLGIQHQPTTAFHPQANGMVERCHLRLKDALRARLAGPDWPLHLPWVLMGLRAAPTEDTGVSAAEVVFGEPLVLPGQILDTGEPPPADFIAKLRQSGPPPPSRPLSYTQMAAKPAAALLSAAFFYVRKGGTVPPLSPLYSGRTGFSPPARKYSGYRLASGRRPCPSTASSRTGGPPPSSQRSRLQEAGRELADFSSHPLPQGLVLARGPVVEQTCELIIWKIPQNVWVENLRNMLYQLFHQSCFSAPA
jgi:hypothetical protein